VVPAVGIDLSCVRAIFMTVLYREAATSLVELCSVPGLSCFLLVVSFSVSHLGFLSTSRVSVSHLWFHVVHLGLVPRFHFWLQHFVLRFSRSLTLRCDTRFALR
jgi:hypothetical protein